MRKLSCLIVLLGVLGLLFGIQITPTLLERYTPSANRPSVGRSEMLRQWRMISVPLGAGMVIGGSALFLMAATLSSHLKDDLASATGRDDGLNTSTQRFICAGLITLAGVGAFLWMLWITDKGPGVSPDSVTYIDAARSLLSGRGFWARGSPMTHYPPGYPLLLSGIGLLRNGDIVQAARFLAALLFAVNAGLLGVAVGICTKWSLSATFSMLMFFLASAPTITAHSMAWSEAPFITFSVAAFIVLSLHVARPSQSLHLVASGLACLAISMRYVGVTLLPAMAFALLVLSDRPVRRRIRECLLTLSIACLPLALWLVRNVMVAHTATNRTLAVHPVDLGHAQALVATVYQFVLPIAISRQGQVLLFGLLSGGSVLGLALLFRKDVRHHLQSVASAFVALSSVFCATYIAFLATSISFFDAHTPVNSRILLPVMLPLTAAGISMARSVSRALGRRLMWSSFVFLAFFSISFNGLHAVSTAVQIHRDGRGYTSQEWQGSETLRYLERIEDPKRLYSNGPDVVLFVAEKDAVRIPVQIHPGTRSTNTEYEEQIREVLAECRQGDALIVYLHGITRWYCPSVEELESQGNLPILNRFDDGVVYGRE